MKNRAKCKLCQSIIESTHRYDYVSCSCGEIAVDGGHEYLRCVARSWENFVRVDDEGNEIVVTVKESNDVLKSNNELSGISGDVSKPNRKELIDMLDEMVKNIENLPSGAMLSPVTHYDFVSLMMLLSSIFKEENGMDQCQG